MQFVYHMKPNQMVGTVLFPLNQLKIKIPKAYGTQITKYIGRESLLDESIPLLNCKWGDVLHFSPLNPKVIFQSLCEQGIHLNSATWFQVPISLLPEAKTMLYKYENDHVDLSNNQIIPFNSKMYNELKHLPLETLQYYKDSAAKGQKPLLFHRVPHVMTQTQIDIDHCQLIEWSD